MIEFLDRFFDPLAFAVVFGGTGVATIFSATRNDLARALGALGPLFAARPARDSLVADQAVRRIQRISEYKGIACADWVKTPVEFVHRAACRLADAEGGQAFSIWAREEMEDRRARHEAAIGVWRHASELAPSMGMIGTVIGLTSMFANMSDPEAMGPAMAIAMLTTLYGLIVGAGLAGPVAARLARLSRAELQWQTRVVERLEVLARSEDSAVISLLDRKVRRAS